MFAEKDQLQCSWGKVDVDGDMGYTLSNPTNQKIYFGNDDGRPMRFWIAGRENGDMNPYGEVMFLYQEHTTDKIEY